MPIVIYERGTVMAGLSITKSVPPATSKQDKPDHFIWFILQINQHSSVSDLLTHCKIF